MSVFFLPYARFGAGALLLAASLVVSPSQVLAEPVADDTAPISLQGVVATLPPESDRAPLASASSSISPDTITSSKGISTNTPQSNDTAAQNMLENRIQKKTDLVSIDAAWPVIGIARVDEESRAFVEALVTGFEQESMDVAEEIAALRTQLEAEGGSGEDFPPAFTYELVVTNDITQPTPRSVSIVWNVWSFTGGAHGQLEIIANNYDRTNGFPVLLEDLFLDPQLAIVQFSKISRQVLAQQDEEKAEDAGDHSFIDEMLRAGTEPEEENFSTFALLPDGIRLYFQPYQVAPWAAGPQTVDISLSDLKNAKPKLEYWNE